AHLLSDVDGEADRTPLVGERSRDRLPDPPGGVGRQLVAHRPVELLDGSDQAQMALLDQVEQWHAGLGVVAGDRHHEPEVAFDQLALGGLVTLVLAPGELSLFGRRQKLGRPSLWVGRSSVWGPTLTDMCGIAGYSLAPSSTLERTLAAQALLAGIAERGADAVGYAHRTPGERVSVHKQRSGASALLDEITVPQSATEVLVHVRDYTKGQPTVAANNHPSRHV